MKNVLIILLPPPRDGVGEIFSDVPFPAGTTGPRLWQAFLHQTLFYQFSNSLIGAVLVERFWYLHNWVLTKIKLTNC